LEEAGGRQKHLCSEEE